MFPPPPDDTVSEELERLELERLELTTARISRIRDLAHREHDSILLWGCDDDISVLDRIIEGRNNNILSVLLDEVALEGRPARFNKRKNIARYLFTTQGGFDALLSMGDLEHQELRTLRPPLGFTVVAVGHHVLRGLTAEAQKKSMKPVLGAMDGKAGRILLSWSPEHIETAAKVVVTFATSRIIPTQYWAFRQTDAVRDARAEVERVAKAIGCEVVTAFQPIKDSPGPDYTNVLTTVPAIFTSQNIAILNNLLREARQDPSLQTVHPTLQLGMIRFASSVDNVIALVRRPNTQSILQFARQCRPTQPPMASLLTDMANAVWILALALEIRAATIDDTDPVKRKVKPIPLSYELQSWFFGHAVLKRTPRPMMDNATWLALATRRG